MHQYQALLKYDKLDRTRSELEDLISHELEQYIRFVFAEYLDPGIQKYIDVLESKNYNCEVFDLSFLADGKNLNRDILLRFWKLVDNRYYKYDRDKPIYSNTCALDRIIYNFHTNRTSRDDITSKINFISYFDLFVYVFLSIESEIRYNNYRQFAGDAFAILNDLVDTISMVRTDIHNLIGR